MPYEALKDIVILFGLAAVAIEMVVALSDAATAEGLPPWRAGCLNHQLDMKLRMLPGSSYVDVITEHILEA